MKQTIRFKTFETNSSSYHSLSISHVNEQPKPLEIEKDKDLTVSTKINVKYIGYTESYCFTAKGSYEKAQLILRFIAGMLENQFEEVIDEKLYIDENGHWNIEKRDQVFKDNFYNLPLIKAYVNAIKQYIGDNHEVKIEFNDKWIPFLDMVSDDAKANYEIFNLQNKDDLKNVEIMTRVINDAIFNPNIEITEECESNE